MATHGGRRPGAGRPPGGISEDRRLLTLAIRRGMAQAVRDRHPGAVGGDDDLAIAAAAEIVRLMMAAGQGDRVLDLLVRLTPADSGRGAGEAGGDRSPLADALDRLPGGNGGVSAPAARQLAADGAPSGASAGAEDGGPDDCQSAGRVFEGAGAVQLAGQLALGVDGPGGAIDGAGGADALQAAAWRSPAAPACPAAPAPAGTPTPPAGQPRGDIHPHRADFDFLKVPEVVG